MTTKSQTSLNAYIPLAQKGNYKRGIMDEQQEQASTYYSPTSYTPIAPILPHLSIFPVLTKKFADARRNISHSPLSHPLSLPPCQIPTNHPQITLTHNTTTTLNLTSKYMKRICNAK